jgi:hypothetical protein
MFESKICTLLDICVAANLRPRTSAFFPFDYWECTGSLLGVRREATRRPLGVFWKSTGRPLEGLWGSPGSLLGGRWEYAWRLGDHWEAAGRLLRGRWVFMEISIF